MTDWRTLEIVERIVVAGAVESGTSTSAHFRWKRKSRSDFVCSVYHWRLRRTVADS